MRYATSALLLTLLGSSAADATVYVWTDPNGVLVLTNDEHDLPKDRDDSVISYSTGASPQMAPSVAAQANAAPDDGPAGPVGAANAGTEVQTRPPQDAVGKQRTLGGATTVPARIPAAGAPGSARDPRASLLRSARRQQPPVIVSVVPSSSRPLSASTTGSSASIGGFSGSNSGSSIGNRRPADVTGAQSMDEPGMFSAQGMAPMR